MTVRHSLSSKFLLGAALALLPLLALIFSGTVSAYRLRRGEVLQSQLTTAQALAALADTLFDEALADAQSIGTVPEVTSLDPREAEAYLQKIQLFYPHYDALALVDTGGRLLAASKPERLGPVTVEDRPYFQQVLRTGRPVLSDLFVSRLTGEPVAVATAPVLDARGETRGALLVTIAAEELAARLSVPRLTGGATSVVLYSPARVLAFHSNRPGLTWEQRQRLDFEPVVAAQRDGWYVGEYTSTLFPEPRLGAFVRTPKHGWVVAVTRPSSDAFAPLQREARLRAAAFLLIVLASMALILRVTRRLVRPIEQLTAQAEALAAGQFGGRVPVTSTDEIGALAEAFNRMAAQLADSHAAQKRALGELRAVLDTVEAAILVVDASRRVRFVNRHFSDWFGLDGESAVGCDLHALLAERIAPQLADPTAALQRLDEGFEAREVAAEESYELLGRRPRSLVRSCSPVCDERGVLLGRVEAFHDVTELRRTEQMRDEFLSAAAHELKTPITAIKGYAQLLLRSPAPLPPSSVQPLQTIDRQCDRLRHLAEDLLQVARLRVGRLSMVVERMDLAALARQALERWRTPEARNPVSLEADAPAWVDADARLITQVLDNLLDNATKYSPPGAPVVVRVTEVAGRAVLSVNDRGFGIPADKQSRIFNPFFRAHSDSPESPAGLGIGLFLSQRIAQQHGSSLEFTSAEGEGSTFSLSLPLAPAPDRRG